MQSRPLILICLFGACTPDVPDTLRYEIVLQALTTDREELDRYVGMSLLDADGEELGTLSRRGGTLEASFEVPSERRPSRFRRGLQLRADGPCGPFTHSLGEGGTATDQEMDSDEWVADQMDRAGEITLRFDFEEPEIDLIPMYVSWGGVDTGVLRIGDMELPAGTDEAIIVTRGCNAPVSVRHEDRVLGELSLDAEQLFVGVDPDACHRFSAQRYSNRGGARRDDRFFVGSTVESLPSAIDFWLQPLPEEVEVGVVSRGDAASAQRTSLEQVECDPSMAPAGGDESPPNTAEAGSADPRTLRERMEDLRRRENLGEDVSDERRELREALSARGR